VTAALEGGEWSAAHPGCTLPPGKTRYPFYRRLGGPQGRSGRVEILVPTGIFFFLTETFFIFSFQGVSRSLTTTHHCRQDSSGRVISSSHRLLPDNTQNSQQTNIHTPGGIFFIVSSVLYSYIHTSLLSGPDICICTLTLFYYVWIYEYIVFLLDCW